MAPDAPSPEISAQPRRRTFTARDKLRILAETDRASGTGQIGAILRREGLYSSNLTDWRKARDAATNGALAPAKRGPKFAEPNPLAAELAAAQKDNARLAKQLDRAFRENRTRFVNKRPNPPDKPTAAWINPPQPKPMVQA